MNFNYIKYPSGRLLFSLLFTAVWLLSGCRSGQDDPIIVINAITRGAVNNNTKGIILVRDNKCLNCSQELVRFAGNITAYKDCLTVISADPDRVDLSPVLSKPGCFMESAQLLDKSHMLPHSACVGIKNGIVSSVTELNANNLDSFMNSFAFKN